MKNVLNRPALKSPRKLFGKWRALLLSLPLATLTQASWAEEVATGENPAATVHAPAGEAKEGGGERRERRPVVRRSTAAGGGEAAKEEEKFLFPSPAFLYQHQLWKLPIGNVTLLQDTVFGLKNRYPECRRIPSSLSEHTARIACPYGADFQADGREVIFSYSTVNEVLTGATLRFQLVQRARRFAEEVVRTLQTSPVPTYSVSTDVGNFEADSPMFSVSLHKGLDGYLVSIESHFQDRMRDSEAYAKARMQVMDFGDLTVGRTKFEELPTGEALPKTCRNVSSPSEELAWTKEYHGVCFGFPYEAHMQLDFDPGTGILERAVLSPIGLSTGNMVEEMLTRKYGLPRYCRRIESDAVLQRVKDEPERRPRRIRPMKGRSASVFVGTCETPILFASDMRYVFENRYLRHEEIMAAFERRKASAQDAKERTEAFGERSKVMKGFFE